MLISTSCAPVNNLHLITLLALDVHTVEVFTDLHVAGRNKFLRWPLGVETKQADPGEIGCLESYTVNEPGRGQQLNTNVFHAVLHERAPLSEV
jgi:hypothetical protein